MSRSAVVSERMSYRRCFSGGREILFVSAGDVGWVRGLGLDRRGLQWGGKPPGILLSGTRAACPKENRPAILVDGHMIFRVHFHQRGARTTSTLHPRPTIALLLALNSFFTVRRPARRAKAPDRQIRRPDTKTLESQDAAYSVLLLDPLHLSDESRCS